MKITTPILSYALHRLLFTVLVFLTYLSVTAAEVQYDYKVTIKAEQVELKKIFVEIEKQTGLYFMYNSRSLRVTDKVSLDVKNAKLEDVLHRLLASRGFSWALMDRAIVLKPAVVAVAEKEVENKDTVAAIFTGVVTSSDGTPLPGATILIKGTKNGTSTNADGIFSLKGNKYATLVVSYTGFQTKQIKLQGGSELTIQMEQAVNDINEAVIVAYGNTTQRKNVGALSVVKGSAIENLPNRSFDRSLQGQVPGLLVTTGTGQPGGGTSNIVLRGIGTGTDVTMGSSIRNPLFIVDGVQVTQDHLQSRIGPNDTPVSNPLAQINPSDIENITVLKDATAIALYGSRASNGVILVTTKKGKAGKTRFNFRHQSDISSRIKGKVEVLNQEQYLDLLYESYKNQNAGSWSDAQIKSDLIAKFPTIVKAPGDTTFYPQPDWFSELYNSHATTISNDISVSGGNEYNTFFLNFEYTSQKGIIKKTGYDRASIRYNFESRPAKWFNFGINSLVSYNKQNLTSVFEDGAVLAGMPYTTSPLLPVRLTNSEFQMLYKFGGPSVSTSNEISNPSAAMEFNENKVESFRGLGNVYAELNLLRSLKFRSNFGIDFLLSNNKEKLDPRLTESSSQIYLPAGGRISDRDLTRSTLTTTNTLQYNHSFQNKHNFLLIIGQEAQIFNSRTISATGTGLASPSYNQVSNATTRSSETNSIRQTLVSYFGQLNYNYKEKYLASISGRKDGSSKFGSQAQYDNYWSLGGGYVLTEESFMSKTSRWLNFLKVRGSIGVAGSDNSINPATKYDILKLVNYAGIAPAVRTNGTPANPYIQSERTFNQDLGFEGKFLDHHIGFTLDLYKRNISNLLYTVFLPASSGAERINTNIGDMENKGIELSLSMDVIRKTDFRWNVNVNWSSNKNKLTKANNILSQTSSSTNLINKVGENFNSFFLVKWAGVNPADGTPQWYDTLGNKISTYSTAQRVITGKPQPDAFGGITNTVNYKNFELSLFFYYQYGFQIYDAGFSTLSNDGGRNAYINQSITVLDRWKKPGDQVTNPKRVLNNPLATTTLSRSTRYLYDGDFIRLKNATLSYNVPMELLKKVKFQAIKLYVQGNNLAIWTKFPGIDPEAINAAGETQFPYPLQQTWSVGLNATL